MKKILFLLIACFALLSFQTNAKQEAATQNPQEVTVGDRVEVLYFHGKRRCATCMAIEENARAAVETHFSPQVSEGKVVFRVIDITQKENEQLAEKYEVTWSALFVVKYKDGKETRKNLTEFAFAQARKSPEHFKDEVVKTVSDMLK